MAVIDIYIPRIKGKHSSFQKTLVTEMNATKISTVKYKTNVAKIKCCWQKKEHKAARTNQKGHLIPAKKKKRFPNTLRETPRPSWQIRSGVSQWNGGRWRHQAKPDTVVHSEGREVNRTQQQREERTKR